MNQQKIAFHYHPAGIDKGEHAVEKADGVGAKHRYLYGIASGSRIDGHGERITDKCIKDFLEQANSGQILLYPDVHGIRQTEDIGILTKAKIEPSGDWWTEYRLYDTGECGAAKAEKIDTLWKQVTGQAPYKRPIQKGFSIEGYIPGDGVLDANKDENGNMSNRVIDKVLLDGVVVVPRPAYQDSIANAIYKALGEIHPIKADNIQNSVRCALRENVDGKEMRDAFYRKKWDINETLEQEIERIMRKSAPTAKQELEILFDEYRDLMVELIMESPTLFNENDADDEVMNSPYGQKVERASKIEVYKSLLGELTRLKKIHTR